MESSAWTEAPWEGVCRVLARKLLTKGPSHQSGVHSLGGESRTFVQVSSLQPGKTASGGN